MLTYVHAHVFTIMLTIPNNPRFPYWEICWDMWGLVSPVLSRCNFQECKSPSPQSRAQTAFFLCIRVGKERVWWISVSGFV